MCGIICVLSRESGRATPTKDQIFALIDNAAAALRPGKFDRLHEAAGLLLEADTLLKGEPGVRALVGNRDLVAGIVSRLGEIQPLIATVEAAIEASDDANAIEQTSGAVASIKDAVWALRNDRLRTAREVEALAGLSSTTGALDGYFAIQQALSAIDRMEVRGRDSAGIGRSEEHTSELQSH